MTKIFQMLVAMLLVSVSASVFAQAGACLPAPMVPGQPQRCYDGRVIPPINAIVGQNPYQGVMGQNIIPPNAVYVQQGQSAPGGYCSWGDRLINIGASGGVGAVIGNLFGGDNKATALGAAMGGLAGVFIPCNQVPVQVVQPVGRVTNQTGVVSSRQSITVPSKCDFGNDVVAYTYEGQAGCEKIAAKMTVAATSPDVPKQNVAQPEHPTIRQGRTCAYQRDGKVLVDYFDKTKNPEGLELPADGAGPQCRELLQKFITANNFKQ